MWLHALMRRSRRLSPILFLVLIISFIKFLKQLPLDHEHRPPDYGGMADVDAEKSDLDVFLPLDNEHQPLDYGGRRWDVDAEKSELDVLLDESAPIGQESSLWLVVQATESTVCYSLAARFHGWNILLIGVHEKNAKHSKCHLLGQTDDVDDFRTLCLKHRLDPCGGEISALTKSMIVALYILQHDPDYIYIAPTSDDPRNVPKPGNIDDKRTSLVFRSDSKKTFNFLELHNRHFGCNSSKEDALWGKENGNYQLCTGIRSLQVTPILPVSDVRCDDAAPPVTVDAAQFVLFSMQGAVVPKELLWVLGLLPLSHTDPYSKETITLLAAVQKLLWLSNHRLKLSYSQFIQNITAQYQNKITNLDKSRDIIRYVNSWTCYKITFKDCVLDIISSVRKKFLNIQQNVEELESKWLRALVQNGYTFPSISSQAADTNCSKVEYSPADYSKPISRSKTWRKVNFPIHNLDYILSVYEHTCKDTKHSNKVLINTPWTQFGDVLLIVVFNNPHYEALPYVEMLYSPFFTHILYCGPEFPNRDKFPELFTADGYFFNRTFLTYTPTPEGHFKGAFNYECTIKAMQMRYSVAGYLTIADDILLWVHSLPKLPRSSVWFLPEKEVRIGDLRTLRECRLGMCDFHPHWNWWEDYREVTRDVLLHLKQTRRESPLVYDCYRNIVRLNGAEFRANGAFSDVYYIPSRLVDDFVEISQIFLDFKVFLEIAIPTVLRCVEPPENVQEVKGTISWDVEDRDKPWMYFKPEHVIGRMFFHPCKWGYMTRANTSEAYRDFMCGRILPYMFDPYERF